MDTDEAKIILQRHLNNWKQLSYAELADQVKNKKIEVIEVSGPSGNKYCLEFQARWDSEPGGAIRGFACIDDGGMAALVPLSADFIVYPEI
jgi:hypothetical protein